MSIVKRILLLLLSFILPVTVLILIPGSLISEVKFDSVPALIGGLALTGGGLTLMTITIISFFRIGKGTLAPWSPPRHLVTSGVYAYVRNPMISGVLMVLTGEAVALLSRSLFQWDLLFLVINQIYFLLLEEPMLEHRFGEVYRHYKKHVPRWIPNFKPYRPDTMN